jgi:hypothetical protein
MNENAGIEDILDFVSLQGEIEGKDCFAPAYGVHVDNFGLQKFESLT